MKNVDLRNLKTPVFLPVEAVAGRPNGQVAEEWAAKLRADDIYANAAFRAGEGGWGVRVLPWA